MSGQARLREALTGGGASQKDKGPPVADGILSVEPESAEAAEWRSRRSVIDSIASCSSYLDEEEDGPAPGDLYGKFTWRIDNFSEVSKRELRSTTFEVGSYKWYILVYPQGCDVANHLSLFLCVADYDKLLPGWAHFAQFTIAVVNKDPKKSKYSDTLHRFCKKEHDWGWKKFMELSKVMDGFTVQDTLVIKAQVQIIRDRPTRPFRCLDAQYRRELVRVYLTNVEGICRRFVEERKETLQRLLCEEFRQFWRSLTPAQQAECSQERADVILKGVVKKFFNEKEVTSTLVMDALYCGCKSLEEAGRRFLQNADQSQPAGVLINAEGNVFFYAGPALGVLEHAVADVIPPFTPDKHGDGLGLRNAQDGDDYSRDSVERDERRLSDLGRRVVEMFAAVHIASTLMEAAWKEADIIRRQDELIKEEELLERAEALRRAAKAEAEKEKRARKKEKAKQRKEAERAKREAEEAERAKQEEERRLEVERKQREAEERRRAAEEARESERARRRQEAEVARAAARARQQQAAAAAAAAAAVAAASSAKEAAAQPQQHEEEEEQQAADEQPGARGRSEDATGASRARSSSSGSGPLHERWPSSGGGGSSTSAFAAGAASGSHATAHALALQGPAGVSSSYTGAPSDADEAAGPSTRGVPSAPSSTHHSAVTSRAATPEGPLGLRPQSAGQPSATTSQTGASTLSSSPPSSELSAEDELEELRAHVQWLERCLRERDSEVEGLRARIADLERQVAASSGSSSPVAGVRPSSRPESVGPSRPQGQPGDAEARSPVKPSQRPMQEGANGLSPQLGGENGYPTSSRGALGSLAPHLAAAAAAGRPQQTAAQALQRTPGHSAAGLVANARGTPSSGILASASMSAALAQHAVGTGAGMPRQHSGPLAGGAVLRGAPGQQQQPAPARPVSSIAAMNPGAAQFNPHLQQQGYGAKQAGAYRSASPGVRHLGPAGATLAGMPVGQQAQQQQQQAQQRHPPGQQQQPGRGPGRGPMAAGPRGAPPPPPPPPGAPSGPGAQQQQQHGSTGRLSLESEGGIFPSSAGGAGARGRDAGLQPPRAFSTPLPSATKQRAQEANVDSPGLDDFAHMGLITDLLE